MFKLLTKPFALQIEPGYFVGIALGRRAFWWLRGEGWNTELSLERDGVSRGWY